MSDSPKTQLLAHSDTLRGYDLWSTCFDSTDNPLVKATEWALDARPLDLHGRRVVELGCGTGRHVARVLAGGATVYVGVDGSAGMLAKARSRVGDPRCDWIHGDLAVDVGTGFDLALIVLVLEHVADLAPPFAAISRALVPGATLRIVELHPERIASGTVAHFHDHDTEVHFASIAHDLGAISRALADAGFIIERIVEDVADGALLSRVPRLAKHRGAPVVLDITARRAP